MICPSEIIDQLDRCGVTVTMVDSRLYVKLPWPPDQAPADARLYLRELKAQRDEVKAFLSSFDENEAYRLFCEASARVAITFLPEVWAWARENQPDLLEAIWIAEQDYSKAYRGRNMAACREAVERYEQGFVELAQAYESRGQPGGVPNT